MQKIDFKIGGHPQLNDDLVHIQNGVYNDIKAITDSLFRNRTGSTPFRLLDGFVVSEPTPGNFTWTSGFCYIDGIVYEIPEETTPQTIDFNLYGVYATTTYDLTIDPVLYENGSPEFVHEKRIIEFKEIATNVGSLGTMTELQRYEGLDVLLQNLLSDYGKEVLKDFIVNDGWVNLTISTGISTIVVQPQVRLSEGLVEFRGRFVITSDTWSFLLPGTYQPPLGVNSRGVAGLILTEGNEGSGTEFVQISTIPFAGGSLEGQSLSTSTTFPKVVDISMFKYYL